MIKIIDKYAVDHGFVLVLDSSSPQSPVVHAANAIDITAEVVKQFDANAVAKAGGAESASASAPPASPAKGQNK